MLADEITFGQVVRERRTALGLTQTELARRVGCAAITIRKIEADDIRPSVQIAQLLAESLGIPKEERLAFVRLARLQKPPSPIPTPAPTRAEIGQEDLTGRAVKGFDLAERIGSGGFGVVYRAEQASVGRDVAVKIILPKYADHPEFIRRFEAEAQTVAQLEHPHIVPLYDYWREPAAAFLIMRLLKGGSLEDLLRAGPLPQDDFREYIRQVGLALDAAHRHGVIHRDIKPANILLDEDQNAYLADFGIAKQLNGRNGRGDDEGSAFIGSPAYISPEQIRSEPVNAQTDIYCLGIMLYEMLTGQKPFRGPTPVAYLQQHLGDPPPSLLVDNPDLPPELDLVLAKALAKDPADRYSHVMDFMTSLEEALSPFFTRGLAAEPAVSLDALATQLWTEAENPYKGLQAFTEADAADFFGRSTLIQELLTALAAPGDLSRFLAVVGPSGSGKSSVVKAGLLPALRRGGLPGSEKWFIVDFIPGAAPWQELATSLSRVAVTIPEGLVDLLQADSRSLLRVVNSILPDDGETELLLVLDQFEELFTHLADETTRVAFLDSLVETILDPDSRVRIVATLRADFLDRPLSYADFGDILRQRMVFALPMMAEELEEAIIKPAEGVGVAFEPGLVTTIIQDVGDQPGTLPLLQYMLTELFEQRLGQLISLPSYQTSGGVTGTLARRADELFLDLDLESQALVRQIFLRLVNLGVGVSDAGASPDTRRRILRSELESVALDALLPSAGDRATIPSPQSPITDVLDIYGKARLLTFDRDPATREPTVEVAHEALLREWARLRNWLEESRNDIRMQRLLSHATAEWQKAGRDPGFLLRGSRLTQFESWLAETDLALTGTEQGYLDASLQERKTREAAETERQAHEATLEKRSRNRLRAMVGIFALAAVVAIALSLFAFDRQNAAEENAELALQGQTTATVAQGEAIFQAATADAERVRAEDEAAARATQQALAEEQTLARGTAQAHAEQQQIIAQDEARAAREAYSLSLAANAREALADEDSELALLLSLAANSVPNPPRPAQRTLMDAAYAPGTKRLFETGHANWAVAASPDGLSIISGSSDGVLRMWDVSSGQLLREYKGHESDILAVAFSPDGKKALSGSIDKTLILWNLESGEVIHRMEGHEGEIQTVAISPDGLTALSGAREIVPGEFIHWDLVTGLIIRHFGSDTENIPEGVRGIAISPDGHRALIGLGNLVDHDRALSLWDLETGEVIRVFEGLTRSVNGVAISPDGRYGLSGSRDDLVRYWDLETGEELLRLEGHDGIVVPVAFGPDGRTALSADTEGTLIWWDLDNGIIIEELRGHQTAIWGLDFLGERNAVSASRDGTLRYWDLTSQWMIDRWDGGDGMQQGLIVDVAISPDGRYAFSSSLNPLESSPEEQYDLVQWDYETGKPIRSLEGHDDFVTSFAFSSDGKKVLTGSADRTLILWDLESGWLLQRMEGHTAKVTGVAISSDDTYLLSSSNDGSAILWYMTSGKPIRYFTGHEYFKVDNVAFAAGDKWAVSSSFDCTLIVWDVETGQQVRRLTGFEGDVGGHVGRECGIDEGIDDLNVSPDGWQLLSAASDGTLLLWDLATGRSLRRFSGHGDYPGSVEFTPDGAHALSGAQDRNVILWDLDSGEMIRRFPVSDYYEPYGIALFTSDVAVSPDGQTAISSEPDGTILKWQLAEPTAAELIKWIEGNRFLRELSCQERRIYQITPLCDEQDLSTGTTSDLIAAVRDALTGLPGSTSPGPASEESQDETQRVTSPIPATPATQTLNIGENRGYLNPNEFDVWTFSYSGGSSEVEMLSLQMVADRPTESSSNDPEVMAEEIAAGRLDPVLMVFDPEGRRVGLATDSSTADGDFSSDAVVEALPLQVSGDYIIQARSHLDLYGGDYTLVAELFELTLDLASFAGNWQDRDGWIATVTAGDGLLIYDISGGNRGTVVPTGAVTFVDPATAIRFEFLLDENGLPVEYVLYYADGSRSSGYRLDE